MRTELQLTVAILAAALAAACGRPEVTVGVPRDGGASPPAGPGSPDGGQGRPPSADGPGFGPLPVSPDGSGAAPPSDETGPKCADDAYMAERVPLDLLLLVDRSSSMAGGKWTMATAALSAFVSDAKSDGLGVGLQFFPAKGGPDTPCANDTDCGFVQGAGDPKCIDRRVCVGPAGVGAAPQKCGANTDMACAAGSMCTPLGRCTLSSLYCTAIGQPCPSGRPNDVCTRIGRTCRLSDFSEACRESVFSSILVRIADLPGVRPTLLDSIRSAGVEGGTPMVPAVKATHTYLRAHQTANPTRRVALILATDGVPSNCSGGGEPVAAVEADIRTARATTPPIATYAIGVFAPAEGADGPNAVNRFAAAGGTGTAFVLNPTNDLTDRLLAALNQIRGAALPCEYTIPKPRTGEIDWRKVNVYFKGTSGAINVPYVGAASKCDPTRGGWYYDVDPAAGVPTKVIVCETTCSRFKADATGRVELGYGCKTVVIE